MPSGAERRAPFWALLLVTVGLDRITKVVAESALGGGERIPVLGDLLTLQLVYNPGAAFGLHLGAWSRWIFLAIAIAAVPILRKLWRETPAGDPVRQYAYGFVAGGAVGNGIDRILSSRGVIDFIDAGIPGGWRWPTFNVADIAVSCGAVVLAICLWREDAQQRAVAAETAAPAADSSAV